MAARTVVPIDRVRLVQVDSCCEVSNGLIEFEEPVPHETSTVVCGCIVRVELDDLIEVIKCKLKTISADLLPHCTKVMHGLNVPWLETDSCEVVSFGFL